MKTLTCIIATIIVTASSRHIAKEQRTLSQDKPPPLTGNHYGYKLPNEDESLYEPLSRQNVKRLLAEAILKQVQLPKLKFSKITQGGAGGHGFPGIMMPKLALPKLKFSGNKIESIQGNKQISSRLPSLMHKPTPLDIGARKPTGSRGSSLTNGRFPLAMHKAQPTWLMSLGELRAETCRPEKYNQTVTSKGCRPVVIESNFCTGRCNSFFVPSADADFQSCASCFPSSLKTRSVYLDCPGRRRGYKIKQVQTITDCKCQSMMSCSPLGG
eukprot:Seg1095.4 transcript_id=Seg1095.4/GoldUCD/mRNA.D3Y31 product=Gremlin-2 protein_id=Seg1095.4/GoldUCD/D3Y31